jgi:hypothetical protein
MVLLASINPILRLHGDLLLMLNLPFGADTM